MRRILMINAGTIREFATSLRSLAFAECLSARGWEVHYVLAFREEDFATYGHCYKGVRMHYTTDLPVVGEMRRPWDELRVMRNAGENIRRRARMVRRIRPDLVHVFKPHPHSLLPALAGCPPEVPVIVDVDDTEAEMLRINFPRMSRWFLRLVDSVERNCGRYAQHVVTVSREFERYFLKQGVPVSYIPNGVFLRKERSFEPPWMKALHGKKVIMYMGNLVPCFEVDSVIRIYRRVTERLPETVLVIVGEGVEEPRLRRLVESEGLSSRVFFTGFVPKERVASYLEVADVLILPMSDTRLNRARCPLKIREYLAAGRPIVASALGEVAEAVGDSRMLVEPGEGDQGFVDRILRLASDPRLAEEEALKNRQRSERFTWEKLASRLAELYEKHLDGGQRRRELRLMARPCGFVSLFEAAAEEPSSEPGERREEQRRERMRA